MRYLLDTNILSDLLRHPQGPAALHLAKIGEDQVCTSIICAGELVFGAAKKGSARLIAQVKDLLEILEVLPLESPMDEAYAEIRVILEREGRLIGNNDLLIAAHCLTLGFALVTDNVREFERVPGLAVENWLR
ncbi:VapC toxin family PIN domain ribonuclease [Paramagnetospirillum kuznetsovii]|uniref:Ribonuclease VapC n=1 Tax=Paramagnetospirillum kuznetsovii TaxID=2053833 RepID=A0A364NW60_9PROT|nr:type II toxin-antitoxin system VapC family toxin [Paramagnetospirillum kuznetsovii]RAU21230.1 VapC toxin family PIN domain ribonuclease [Paramagnetospirillum kuznetsovii]